MLHAFGKDHPLSLFHNLFNSSDFYEQSYETECQSKSKRSSYISNLGHYYQLILSILEGKSNMLRVRTVTGFHTGSIVYTFHVKQVTSVDANLTQKP